MKSSFTVRWIEETPSTSALLLDKAGDSDFDGLVIAAKRQTAGKGRRGRTWFTADGNIACSIGFSFSLQKKDIVATAPLFVGVCAYDAVCEYLDSNARSSLTIKWPNDLVWNQKKLMGVLSQSRVLNGKLYLAIGVGLNIVWAPGDLPAVALQEMPLLRTCPTREEFLETLLAKFTLHHRAWSDYSRLKSLWEERVTYLGRTIRFGLLEEEENMQEAKAIGLDDSGALIVEHKNGVRESLLTQDLSLRL